MLYCFLWADKKVEIHIIVLGVNNVPYAGNVQRQFLDADLVAEIKLRGDTKLEDMLIESKAKHGVDFGIILGPDNNHHNTVSFKPLGN